MDFLFAYDTAGGVLSIGLEGDLLGLNEERQVLEVVDEHIVKKYMKCVLDLSSIQHMNSTGLSYIIRIFNRFNEIGGRIIMIKPPKNVYRLIEITKLDQICHFVDNYNEGLLQVMKK
ncbi:STAS domain-containing protein [Flammeovirgaceae bacterium SG7u.111]|nr:STAS domain-containing protein [Flammeovirgaceae bacterium SG7u.132]WPO36118.1 STAS domain-containing protein [Flammeovirgaceae bacterium SG7u.111]